MDSTRLFPPVTSRPILRAGLVLGVFLAGCASGLDRRGAPSSYAQALDSETNACARFPASCPGMPGGDPGSLAARQRLAEVGASLAAGVRILDDALQQQLDRLVLDCVIEVDFQINERRFGGNPTREQCSEQVGRGSQGHPVTRAMLLGREKHEAALACIQEKLRERFAGSFSLNPRYRYNPHSERWEPLSAAQERALLRAGGEGLMGTLVPDIVIHSGNPIEVLDVYDLKFPCPGTNFPDWRKYPDGHPHEGLHQGQLYQQAFGGDPARVAPRWGVLRGW